MFPHTVGICWSILPNLCYYVFSGMAPYYFRTGFLIFHFIMEASPTHTGLPPHLFGSEMSEHLTVLWPLLVTLQAHMSTDLTCFVEKHRKTRLFPMHFQLQDNQEANSGVISRPSASSYEDLYNDVSPSYDVCCH